jgi:predicted DNA-binding antitoxin AbrB/MazE fold protein
MVYRGRVENGIIRLEASVVLPEGAEVPVELAASAKEQFDPNAPTIEEKLAAIVTFPRRNGTACRQT